MSPFERWSTERNFQSNEELWNSQNISSYEYRLEYWSTFWNWQVTMRVEDGVNTLQTVISGEPSYEYELQYVNTVTRLFEIIRDALEGRVQVSGIFPSETLERPPGDVIKVTYDDGLGFPTSIFIDPYIFGWDDQYIFEITDFRVLE